MICLNIFLSFLCFSCNPANHFSSNQLASRHLSNVSLVNLQHQPEGCFVAPCRGSAKFSVWQSWKTNSPPYISPHLHLPLVVPSTPLKKKKKRKAMKLSSRAMLQIRIHVFKGIMQKFPKNTARFHSLPGDADISHSSLNNTDLNLYLNCKLTDTSLPLRAEN